ncbi:DNA-binding protein [Methylorubrum thiocyanatum]|uniref:DNA-binding protein n=1 Tax=Methylorubrum thiocyanatum TaxID=47958 RepID=UPI0036487251
MADQDEIYRVADLLLAEGRTVSQASVRDRLKDGGSYRDIAPILRHWKVDRNYRSRPGREDLPASVVRLLDAFAVEAWKAARLDAHASLENDRAKMSEQQRVSEGLVIELAAAADAAEHRVAVSERAMLDARDRADRLEGENTDLRRQVDLLERRVRRLKAEAYWDLVMRTIQNLLPTEHGLTAEEIVAQLPSLLGEHAWGQHDPITPPILKEKMRVRVGAKKYFRLEGGDRFCRLV